MRNRFPTTVLFDRRKVLECPPMDTRRRLSPLLCSSLTSFGIGDGRPRFRNGAFTSRLRAVILLKKNFGGPRWAALGRAGLRWVVHLWVCASRVTFPFGNGRRNRPFVCFLAFRIREPEPGQFSCLAVYLAGSVASNAFTGEPVFSESDGACRECCTVKSQLFSVL